MYVRFFANHILVPWEPPGVLCGPIVGPNRGMFSKLNVPSPLGSGGHSYTSFSIGRFYAPWNSFGGDVAEMTSFCFFQTFKTKSQSFAEEVLLKIQNFIVFEHCQ